MTEQLNSSECVVALEAAVRAITGGNAALDTAIADVIAARPV